MGAVNSSRCAWCGQPATKVVEGFGICDKCYPSVWEDFEDGVSPSRTAYLYCVNHCDLWEPGCERCEECSQYHYGKSVAEALPGNSE